MKGGGGDLNTVLCRYNHDDVIKWKHFPRYWPFVWGIHRWPVNSPHKGQWHWALMFSLICIWINAWANNREAGDLRHHHAHYDIIVIFLTNIHKGVSFVDPASDWYSASVPVIIYLDRVMTALDCIKMPTYQYEDPYYQIWLSLLITFIMGILISGKMIFILKQCPAHWCAGLCFNIKIVTLYSPKWAKEGHRSVFELTKESHNSQSRSRMSYGAPMILCYSRENWPLYI